MGKERDSGRESRSDIICLEGNGYRPSHKGDGYRVGGAMYTLNETEVHAVCYGVDLYNQCLTGGVSKTLNNRATDADNVPCVICYGISAYESNAMKSSNPHSGIYIAETSRTLDFNGGNPACNQGGVLVLCIRTEAEKRR